jgi:hypothetical protein
MGEPLPQRLWAELPAVLQAWEPAAPGRPARAKGRLPLGLATTCADLGAQVAAVQARITTIEAACTPLAERLPAYALLRTIPGVGPTVGAILLAEIGDIAWFTQFSQLRKLAGLDIIWVATGQWTGAARISRGGRPLLRWALYQAALGAARTAAGRAHRDRLRAKRAGDPHAFFKANVELAAKLLRLVWGVWRSGRPYDPARVGRGPAVRSATVSPAAPTGRRGAPPADQGRASIGDPRARQAGRSSDTQAAHPGTGPLGGAKRCGRRA